jgi:pimeloyl-ACP methyl ester carboxylesterase
MSVPVSDLYVQTAGKADRPALLFLHGGGLSSRQWQPQIERLSDEFYCIAPDLAEQGQSAQIRPFTLRKSAEQVAAIVRRYAPQGKAHVIGLSLGGAVALSLLQIAPEVVDHVLISGTAAGLGKLLGGITRSSTWMYRLLPSSWLVSMAYMQFGIPAEYRQLLHDDLKISMTAHFTDSYVRELMNMTLPSAVTSPVLVVVGEHETVPAKQAAHKLVGALRGARGLEIPAVGHVWNLQAPDLFAELVRAWVQNRPLPPGPRPLDGVGMHLFKH